MITNLCQSFDLHLTFTYMSANIYQSSDLHINVIQPLPFIWPSHQCRSTFASPLTFTSMSAILCQSYDLYIYKYVYALADHCYRLILYICLQLFIFTGTKFAGFNRMRFLIECLEDLDSNLRKFGGRLYVFHGKSADVLTSLFKVCFVCLIVCLVVFNATFNNISVILWWSVLLVEETGGPRENHRPVTSHWHALSHNVVHLALIEIHNISGDR